MSESLTKPANDNLAEIVANIVEKYLRDSSAGLPKSSSIDQFCERHHVGRTLVYELLAQGKGPRTIKIGARTRILDTDEREWLDQLRAQADGAAK